MFLFLVSRWSRLPLAPPHIQAADVTVGILGGVVQALGKYLHTNQPW